VLNFISDVPAAADARTAVCQPRTAVCQPATGAFLPGRVDAAYQRSSGALMLVRPRGVNGTGVYGQGRKAAVHGLPQGQQSIRQQFPTMTRSAAATGGALGPHPARDPV
jgi:hypothetical protein